MQRNAGFRVTWPGDGTGRFEDVLRPYGVWGIISPFNFPLALAANPISAALLAGNCVVFKPAHLGVLTGLKSTRSSARRASPTACCISCPGRDPWWGAASRRIPTCEASRSPGPTPWGINIYRDREGAPRPAICELGGKNPSVVSDKADLDKATDGVMHGAFGFGGQKCASNSRCYIHRSVYDEFVSMLRAKAEQIVIGDPRERGVYLGPLINDEAGTRFGVAVAEAREVGTVITGGERLTGDLFDRGNYVQPTIVEAPDSSWLWKRELFNPFVAVAPFDDLGEAIARANDTEFGLTAGFFSEDEGEIERFLDDIESGVVYVNRRASATTGAWPGMQAFGGWKGSGTTGRSVGGPFYVAQYMQEQSRSVITG